MKNHIVIPLLIGLIISGYSDTPDDVLEIDYKSGWTKGFVLKLDAGTSTFSLHDRTTEKRYKSTAINSQNTIDYIVELLGRISEEENIIVIDGSRLQVKINKRGKKTYRTVYPAIPPGRILYNEGFLEKEELEDLDDFKKNVESFVLGDLVDQIVELHFHDKKEFNEKLYIPSKETLREIGENINKQNN